MSKVCNVFVSHSSVILVLVLKNEEFSTTLIPLYVCLSDRVHNSETVHWILVIYSHKVGVHPLLSPPLR